MKYFLLLLFFSLSALSFDGRKCDQFISGKGGFNRLGISSAQFTTSTGDCSMLGKIDHDSKVFIAHNVDKFKVDFARGRGEYAMAFASIYGCSEEGQLLFPVLMKSKFSDLVEKEDDLESTHKILVNEIQSSPYMIANCGNGLKG